MLLLTPRARSRETLSTDTAKHLPATFFLVLLSYLYLVHFDLFLSRGDFAKLYDRVRNYATRKHAADSGATDRICTAVDLASICYWKRVLCLQRSAATACLLKHFGVPAEMAIGVQQMPFKAHAWVEVDGRVVSDKPYMREMYAVLDRC
jgi:hypothetical protein